LQEYLHAGTKRVEQTGPSSPKFFVNIHPAIDYTYNCD
jgi:hypothetical protein